jgi:gamma-glutamylputrescine oxidase
VGKRSKLRDWGEPLWPARTLSIPSEPAPRTTDVAVVGAGLTGVSAALHLARAGLAVTVFEATSIGDGASGRTGGIVLEGTAVGIRPGADNCVPALAHLVAELEIECDLQLPGCWEIEHLSESGDTALPWYDDGSPIRIARKVVGGTVEPRALLFGLAEAARRYGANIIDHSPVRRIQLSGPAVEVDERIVECAHVVVAVNAWSSALLDGLPRVHSALTYACATEPLSDQILRELGLADRLPFYTADRPYLWGRVATHGEIVFGTGLKYGAARELEHASIATQDSLANLQNLVRRIRGLNPALAKIVIWPQWAGPIAFTDEAVPLLGKHPRNPAILVAGAYAGHGVALSVRAGELMARAILHNEPLPNWGALTR